MIYRTCTPQPPLANFVDKFWFYEGDAPQHTKERKLPDGTVELIFNLHDDFVPVYDRQNPDHFQTFLGNLICGVHSKFFVIDTASQSSVIGVHFKPGGAFPFFNLPASELHNTHVALDTLWGASATRLREQLLEAETPETRFRILERSLLTHSIQPLAHHPAVAFALKEFQSSSPYSNIRTVSDVTKRIGLSPRRFIQIFSEEVGLTPKLFCRVRRFQEVLRLIRKEQQVKWMDIALSCGYFDQAHFIHDFHAFSGLNPGAYLIQRSEHPNHVPIHE